MAYRVVEEDFESIDSAIFEILDPLSGLLNQLFSENKGLRSSCYTIGECKPTSLDRVTWAGTSLARPDLSHGQNDDGYFSLPLIIINPTLSKEMCNISSQRKPAWAFPVLPKSRQSLPIDKLPSLGDWDITLKCCYDSSTPRHRKQTTGLHRL